MIPIARFQGLGNTKAPTLAYLAEGYDTSGTLTDPTTVNISFGTADPDRVLIGVFGYARSSTTGTVVSATIGGVSATVLTDIHDPDSSSNPYAACCIFMARVPTGTSGDVVIDTTNQVGGAILTMYRATNIISFTTLDLQTDIGASPLSATVTAQRRSVVLAAGYSFNNNVNHTWTGVTEQNDYNGDAASALGTLTTAIVTTPIAFTQNITAQVSSSGSDEKVLAVVVLR
jgi:hypothetical protein